MDIYFIQCASRIVSIHEFRVFVFRFIVEITMLTECAVRSNRYIRTPKYHSFDNKGELNIFERNKTVGGFCTKVQCRSSANVVSFCNVGSSEFNPCLRAAQRNSTSHDTYIECRNIFPCDCEYKNSENA